MSHEFLTEISGGEPLKPVAIPDDIEFHSADGVFVKAMVLNVPGTAVPQHSHTYDHLSMVASGAVRVYENDALLGDFKAPAGINIKAGVKHTFLSLAPKTVVLCIHNVSRTGEVEIADRHEFSEG